MIREILSNKMGFELKGEDIIINSNTALWDISIYYEFYYIHVKVNEIFIILLLYQIFIFSHGFCVINLINFKVIIAPFL